MQHQAEHNSFGDPEETRESPNGKAEILSSDGAEAGRMTFEPGLALVQRRQTDRGNRRLRGATRPVACERRLAMRMDDGTEMIANPARASIPELDETARDQEELSFVVSGSPTLVIDGEDHPAPAGTFAWVDPPHRRVVRNDSSKPASVLIVSAPRTSGCTPMGWA